MLQREALTPEEVQSLGAVVGLVNSLPGQNESLLACWDGDTWKVRIEGATWQEVLERFYPSGAPPTIYPEFTAPWRDPDWSGWTLYRQDPRTFRLPGIYAYVFAPGVKGSYA